MKRNESKKKNNQGSRNETKRNEKITEFEKETKRNGNKKETPSSNGVV
jgi:hypothetical protein